MLPNEPAETPVPAATQIRAGSAHDQSSVTLTPSSSSVAAARHLVQKAFETWGCDEAAWEATQLVSELATNAVLHAGTEFTVDVSRWGDHVRVSVSDLSATAPALRPYRQDATTGRGLQLVANIARSWGFSTTLGGKVVWFELDLA